MGTPLSQRLTRRVRTVRVVLRRSWEKRLRAPLLHHLRTLMTASTRIRLPAPVALPVAGAVVGVYAGLLAGIFANLISVVTVAVVAASHPTHLLDNQAAFFSKVNAALAEQDWHAEVGFLAALPAAVALALVQRLPDEGALVTVRRRLKALSLMTLGALALYYPLLFLSVLNHVWQSHYEVAADLARFPALWVLLAPAAGGLLAGRLLRDRPETHGHGIPEVALAVRREGDGLTAEGGALKITASALTIGSGGSAGREGPIVYGGAAIAAAVARFMGFARRDLVALLAAGAGAGIAASFNAPVAGAIFSLEIILRDFRVRVFTPIILASVTATMVGRTVLGPESILRRISYRMVSGWEVALYLLLGLSCGLLAFAFIRLLHETEDFFGGRHPTRLSRFLARRSLSTRAAIGGLLVGALALINPTVWGTGGHFASLAAASQLPLSFLLFACALKLVGTALSIGSGGSGGTFFPSTVIGAMAGGAFGTVVNSLLPAGIAAPSGAYAVVGMAALVAGTTRGPLTGMMMVYELTGNYQIILPLMVCCTVSSALCHFLVDQNARRPGGVSTLERATVGEVMVPLSPVAADCPLAEVLERVLASGETALPVLDRSGRVQGVIQIHELHAVWSDRHLLASRVADDSVHLVRPLPLDQKIDAALATMDREDLDVLPVYDERSAPPTIGVVTRAAIRRRAASDAADRHAAGTEPVAATEVDS